MGRKVKPVFAAAGKLNSIHRQPAPLCQLNISLERLSGGEIPKQSIRDSRHSAAQPRRNGARPSSPAATQEGDTSGRNSGRPGARLCEPQLAAILKTPGLSRKRPAWRSCCGSQTRATARRWEPQDVWQRSIRWVNGKTRRRAKLLRVTDPRSVLAARLCEPQHHWISRLVWRVPMRWSRRSICGSQTSQTRGPRLSDRHFGTHPSSAPYRTE